MPRFRYIISHFKQRHWRTNRSFFLLRLLLEYFFIKLIPFLYLYSPDVVFIQYGNHLSCRNPRRNGLTTAKAQGKTRTAGDEKRVDKVKIEGWEKNTRKCYWKLRLPDEGFRRLVLNFDALLNSNMLQQNCPRAYQGQAKWQRQGTLVKNKKIGPGCPPHFSSAKLSCKQTILIYFLDFGRPKRDLETICFYRENWH